jgi:hypothetical protein
VNLIIIKIKIGTEFYKKETICHCFETLLELEMTRARKTYLNIQTTVLLSAFENSPNESMSN